MRFFSITAAVFAAVLISAAAWMLSRFWPERASGYEKLARNRGLGVVLAAAALFWCVPHAEAVMPVWCVPHDPAAFGFMKEEWWHPLYLLAALVAVSGYFYVDYLFARALGGLMILAGYYFVHGAFEYGVPGAAAITALSWIWGIAGIAFSGRPAWVRDAVRKCCAGRLRCSVTAGFLLLYAAALLYGAGGMLCLSR